MTQTLKNLKRSGSVETSRIILRQGFQEALQADRKFEGQLLYTSNEKGVYVSDGEEALLVGIADGVDARQYAFYRS